MITCNKRYLYKINLDTAAQVTEFNRIASKCDGDVFLEIDSQTRNYEKIRPKADFYISKYYQYRSSGETAIQP